jgi:hypothetical protein
MKTLASAILLLVGFGLQAHDAAAALKDDLAVCALSLTPEVTIINSSRSLKTSWLSLITENTYESAKQQIKSSGDAELLGLIGANGSFSWDQFNEKRRDYLKKNAGTLEEQQALSVFHQSLPSRAGENFIECVKLVMTGASGLHAWFSEETADFAVLHVKFRGSPNTSVAFKLSTTGGTGVPQSATLPHDGEIQYNVKRAGKSAEIRVIATSTSPEGLSDSVVSVRPSPAVGPPMPSFVPEATWSLVGADQPSSCQYSISNKELKVTAYDMPADAHLTLRVRGGHVAPGAGEYPIPQADFPVVGARTLDDFELGPSSDIAVLGPGGASAKLLQTPNSVPNCRTYRLRFSSAKIVIHAPSPVYVQSTTIYQEQHEYRSSGDYHLWGGDYGCPPAGPGCGNLFFAELTSKLTQPVARIEEVAFLAQTGNTQWYRCYSYTPVCGTKGEITALADKNSVGNCVGSKTCISWRYSTSGDPAADTYSIKYRTWECVRYCPPK